MKDVRFPAGHDLNDSPLPCALDGAEPANLLRHQGRSGSRTALTSGAACHALGASSTITPSPCRCCPSTVGRQNFGHVCGGPSATPSGGSPRAAVATVVRLVEAVASELLHQVEDQRSPTAPSAFLVVALLRCCAISSGLRHGPARQVGPPGCIRRSSASASPVPGRR